MDLHIFPIPPSTSLSTQSLWVFPVHQVRALVSCIQPGPSLHSWCFLHCLPSNWTRLLLFLQRYPVARMKSTHLNSFLPQNKLLVYPKHVCCCSIAKSCLILCDPMDCMLQASLSFTISWSLLKLTFTELMLVSNHLIFCHPLLFLPSISPSIRVSSNESSLQSDWQSIGTSAPVLPRNIQGLYPLGLAGLISLLPRTPWRS